MIFSIISNYQIEEGEEEPDLLSAFEIAAFVGRLYARDFSVGDDIVVRHRGSIMKGTVRYLGPVKGFASSSKDSNIVGVEVKHSKGDNDGSFKNKRYFTCKEKCGIFEPTGSVELLSNFDLAKEWIFSVKGVSAPAEEKKVPPLERKVFVQYLKQQDWVTDLLSRERLVPSKLQNENNSTLLEPNHRRNTIRKTQ